MHIVGIVFVAISVLTWFIPFDIFSYISLGTFIIGILCIVVGANFSELKMIAKSKITFFQRK